MKVNMDGVAVGRKVDLNAYSSYERLLQALEEMFQPTAGKTSYLYCFISYGCFIISNGIFLMVSNGTFLFIGSHQFIKKLVKSTFG